MKKLVTICGRIFFTLLFWSGDLERLYTSKRRSRSV